MTFSEILAFIQAHPQEITQAIVLVATLCMYIREVWNGRLKLNEAMLLLVNTLKVEQKMTPDGKFQPELVESKVEAVGNAIGVSKATVEVVKETLKSQDNSLKIGSYKGQPITLNKVAKIGEQLAGALGVLKALRGK